VVVSRQGQNFVVKSIFNFFLVLLGCLLTGSAIFTNDQSVIAIVVAQRVNRSQRCQTKNQTQDLLAAGHMYGSAYALCWTPMIFTVRKQKKGVMFASPYPNSYALVETQMCAQ
jgi:hypothetical protein